jgi:predicted metal-binding membrane protein
VSPLQHILRQDRLVVFVCLMLTTILAWAYVLHLASGMSAEPAMPGMNTSTDMSMGMDMAMTPMPEPWNAVDFSFAVLMWSVMMVGMMAPSVAPTILLYATVGRFYATQGGTAQARPFAATGWFAGGYFLAWIIFSLGAALAQTALTSAMLLTPSLKSTSTVLSGGVLIVAGLYQYSPWKSACLQQCRAPLSFIQNHGGFKPQAGASLRLGLRHGLYCVGCCWALTLLLFVMGVMNLFWIAALAALVLAEKLWSRGVLASRAAGIAAIAGGVYLIAQQWA